jgi:hypothetical protein
MSSSTTIHPFLPFGKRGDEDLSGERHMTSAFNG